MDRDVEDTYLTDLGKAFAREVADDPKREPSGSIIVDLERMARDHEAREKAKERDERAKRSVVVKLGDFLNLTVRTQHVITGGALLAAFTYVMGTRPSEAEIVNAKAFSDHVIATKAAFDRLDERLSTAERGMVALSTQFRQYRLDQYDQWAWDARNDPRRVRQLRRLMENEEK